MCTCTCIRQSLSGIRRTLPPCRKQEKRLHTGDRDGRQKAAGGTWEGRLICSWVENFLAKAPCVVGLKEAAGRVDSSVRGDEQQVCGQAHWWGFAWCLGRCTRWGQCRQVGLERETLFREPEGMFEGF